MKIEKNKVVTIHYVLRGDDNQVIDDSRETAPLQYIHGDNYLLPKLEEMLEGKTTGDTFTADLSAKDGYGEYDEKLIITVPRENFETDMPIEKGMKFHAMTNQGPQIVTVKDIANDTITIDANHDLAGKNLHFEIEVLDVRDATEKELANGLGGGCSCGGCGGECGGDCVGDCSCGGGCGCN